MKEHTITVPADIADLLAEALKSGRYASELDAIREGLRNLTLGDEVEVWLGQDVLPAVEAHERDPSRASSADKVFERLEARYRADVARAGK